MTTKVTNVYNLKLTPSQFGQSSLVVNCSQYDSLFRVIQFNLFNGNAVYSIPEGSVVTIRGTKKDLTGFEYECDFYNNVVTFPIRDQITIYAGKVPAELRIVNDGEIIGSWNFLFLVEESPLTNDTIISETDLPLLESALQASAEAENYKNLAQASADNASQSAETASESEANALTYSQNARSSANSASQSEANALTYSQNASESASEAQGFAQDASDTAQGVTESVNLAQTYAQNASQSASEAENAKNLANQAISNISTFNNTTYPNAISGLQSEGASQIANIQAEGTTQVDNVQAKGTEVLDSIPSDYTSLSNQVKQADLYALKRTSYDTQATGWKLNDSLDGLCSSNADYRLLKYIVHEGDLWKVETDDLYQFNTVANVPSSGQSNRVGKTYTSSESDILVVPEGATYLIVSTSIANDPMVYRCFPKLSDYETFMSSKNLCGIETGIYYPVNLPSGSTLTFSTKDGYPLGYVVRVAMFDENKNNLGSGSWTFASSLTRRTFTTNYDVPIRYMRVEEASGTKEWQIEVGDTPTGYVPYSYNIKDYDVIRKLAGDPVTSSNLIAQSFNSSYHEGATDFATKCTQFSSLMNGADECESFLFFTDPHLLESTGWEANCYEKIAQIQKYYNSTPTSFCLCGGDWLGNNDSVDSACFKLGYIDGFMHSMFKDVYLMVGNHDTNYQGAERLSENTINNLWYRKEGKAYYTIDGVNTKFYVFDTGIEAQALTAQDNYGMRQAEWFASSLLSDNSSHIAVALHILYNTIAGRVIHPLTEQILSIAEAYNGRTSITFNGNTYDYASATGKVEFAIFGHTHDDYVFTLHGIPCIITTWVRASTTDSTFDLVLVDYTNRQINLVRVGSGSDRTVALI